MERQKSKEPRDQEDSIQIDYNEFIKKDFVEAEQSIMNKIKVMTDIVH